VGRNWHGAIANCYAAGSVMGNEYVGGLVGEEYGGTIDNSYSTCSVSGDQHVGGLAGGNSHGAIANCYAAGSVIGNKYVGGLVGEEYRSTIASCYSTGSVSGEGYVGGLVGYNWNGQVNNSFWDTETSGQDWSAGGTGLPTSEMQTMSTFTDVGWDFVGESFNGIEDIWFIPQQDYPRLWWQGMQVPLKLTPRKLNCRGKGKWVNPLYVFVNKDKLVEIQADFEPHALCTLAGDWPQTLTVVGLLTDGNIFLGTSTVRINHPGMKVIEELAMYWLNENCDHPDFCNETDMNRDSIVNLPDYALLLNSQVEFIIDE
jgi:hypothetical protein